LDGSANPEYRHLIEKFHELTGVPVVLNTSFNIRGEPIVMTPDDALNCYFFTGIDALVLGNYVLEKGL
jgi:carbamoyltransferase